MERERVRATEKMVHGYKIENSQNTKKIKISKMAADEEKAAHCSSAQKARNCIALSCSCFFSSDKMLLVVTKIS